jgi:hypothetical protein
MFWSIFSSILKMFTVIFLLIFLNQDLRACPFRSY